MPKVSVIIPTYNRGYIVHEAIGSVLSQTESDVEVLVVDDGSTDDTREVVESIGDSRIVYIFKNNGGVSSARNVGVTKATGEYIAFLDSDDLWPSNYLSALTSGLQNNPAHDAAYTAVTMVLSDGSRIESYKKPAGKNGNISQDLFLRGFIWPSASLFKSSLWESFRFDEKLLNSSEDSDAFLRLSLNCSFAFIDSVESFHRTSCDSISAEKGVSCNRLLSLERFYFRQGGKSVIPVVIARRRLSRSCRRVAEHYRKKMAKKAALVLYFRALRYWPVDVRLYVGVVKALLLSKGNDKEPDWQMPAPLGAISCSD
jgi:glycosyltransferase involved in cell wall biosynthesis